MYRIACGPAPAQREQRDRRLTPSGMFSPASWATLPSACSSHLALLVLRKYLREHPVEAEFAVLLLRTACERCSRRETVARRGFGGCLPAHAAGNFAADHPLSLATVTGRPSG